jgi:transcription-repair coupling factor (superfamily II helicase)
LWDVGFGKTEVAIRAAFKAVDNSKQVAIWFLQPFWLTSITALLQSV